MILDEQAFRRFIKEAVREAIREERAEAAPAADDYLPVVEASRIAHVAPETIRSWIDAGKLGRYHAGRVLRVKRGELEALLSGPPRTAALGSVVDLSPTEAADAYLARRRAAR